MQEMTLPTHKAQDLNLALVGSGESLYRPVKVTVKLTADGDPHSAVVSSKTAYLSPLATDELVAPAPDFSDFAGRQSPSKAKVDDGILKLSSIKRACDGVMPDAILEIMGL
mmetsp:Transcript_9374/g.16595  ORF Transcript_9374/g.16595 Transcript_9374/m.16595 type:complete len:111 (-) Transcript_9374:709-1041(-)